MVQAKDIIRHHKKVFYEGWLKMHLSQPCFYIVASKCWLYLEGIPSLEQLLAIIGCSRMQLSVKVII
jgi:hypothetical protein